jgi:hypothetical protein
MLSLSSSFFYSSSLNGTISPLSSFFGTFCSQIIMASPVASAALKARVRNPAMLKKLARPEDLMHHFPNGSYIGWSGFTAVGYPKYVYPPFLHSSLLYN